MQGLTPSYCCGGCRLQWKPEDEVLCNSYNHPSCWCNLTSSIVLYNIHRLRSSRSSTSYPLFYYCVHCSLPTRRSLQGSGKGKVHHSWSGNQSSSNWTLLLRQSFCIATCSDGLPFCCCAYSAQSTRLHLGICCTWPWGHDPSHSGMLLVLLSGQSRWPQVYTVIDDPKGDNKCAVLDLY